ncbi:PPR domain-containing protein/PPR_2 domain-containing protein [Cephalotus follicularis]|uniref:PPR domain-containing protein/PPR_2 domain-containing protein n=1 Tax=Cephalotus follicularis TaxID=3775 RepID=A0A1Q3DDN7_CEPFO|nr:PPR domain-containing protein/PPR_2 domain-containing protein [Cephalotus follicularis]
MRKLGVFGDGFTFPLIIRACALMVSVHLCINLHNHVVHMGFQNHLHVVNELIGMYSKLRQMDCARNLFNRMPARSYISWNTMVSGFVLNCYCDGALEMFRRMEFEGLEPNLVTWTSLLSSHARCGLLEEVMKLFGKMRTRGIGATAEALAVVLSVCSDLVWSDMGMAIHGFVIKGGFGYYLFVKNALICLYGKHGLIGDAKKLFLATVNKNSVSWNALITSYAESGLCDEALVILLQMKKSGSFPIVSPNVISWTAVISAFASQGREEESLDLFRQMQFAKVMANSVTLSSVLSVCAESAALNLGREIHGHAIKTLINKNILVENGLVNMYTKCGTLKEGYLVFEKMDKKDLISWNSMITGYGMHGLGENALATFDQMIKSGFKLDGVTFVAVLSACSHSGLIAEGCRLFDMMIRENSIQPQMDHYSCMVDLLGRAGLLQEASDIVKNMPMEPNASVWGALLNSCRMHRDTEIAEETASQVFGLNS